ncbi:MAG: NADH-quinone oxidoreductase subunit J, partial [Acidobacteria bacterium]
MTKRSASLYAAVAVAFVLVAGGTVSAQAPPATGSAQAPPATGSTQAPPAAGSAQDPPAAT